jgi:hypothetical protein
MCVCGCVCVCVCVCVCLYRCIYIYICMCVHECSDGLAELFPEGKPLTVSTLSFYDAVKAIEDRPEVLTH